MKDRELERLLELLLKLSETTEASEGKLRDDISRVRHAVYERLGE